MLAPFLEVAEVDAMLNALVEADEDPDADIWETILLQADYHDASERVHAGLGVTVR